MALGGLVRLHPRHDGPRLHRDLACAQPVQLVLFSFLARLAINYTFALKNLDGYWCSTVRTVVSACRCWQLDLDQFSQGLRTTDTRQVPKGSHATFCMVMEYKAIPVMRALGSLRAGVYEVGVLMCNLREHSQLAPRTRGKQCNEGLEPAFEAAFQLCCDAMS